MTDCPSREQLHRLSGKSWTGMAYRQLEEHLETCMVCQDYLEELCDGTRQLEPVTTAEIETAPVLPGFELLEKLGRGGMGLVYKARQSFPRRLVAVKLLLAGDYADALQRDRLRREAEAVARLQHPNIVQIHEVREVDGMPVLVLEFAEGGSLAQKLDGRPVPATTAALWTETLALALHYVHNENIIHRDLKPANILLFGPPGIPLEKYQLKITDFGLAKQDGTPGSVEPGTIFGTPSYMAPEQALGLTADARTDVYALGAVCYHLLTGRPPFQAATPVETLEQVRDEEPVPPRRLQPKVARDLETICLKCLHKEPSRRYPNAAALAEDLDRFLHGRPVHARPVGLVGHTARWCRRKPMIAILAGLLILAVAGGLLTSLLLWRQAAGSEARALANLQNEEVARQEAEDTLRMTLQILEDNVVVSEALEGPDATPAQIDLLLHAEASYSHLLEKRGQDQKLQAQLAFVLVRLGNYYYSHAREIESLVFFEKATRLFEPLAPEGARQPEYIAAAVRAYSHLGFAYDLQGRLEQARQAFATSLCFWQELAKLPPTEPQCDAFVIGIQIARHLRDNSHSEKEIQDWFVHRPVGPEVLGGSQQYDLFLNLIRVMLTCYQESGQPVAKLAAARDGSAVLGRYYQDASLSRNGRFWLAIYSTEVGFFLRRSGASAEALDLLNRANRTLQELAVDTPEDPYLLAKLSHSWMHISRAHWELDQVNETMEDYRHSLAAQRQACLLAPAVTEYRQVLGQRYLQLVRKLCELGRLDVAEACLQERQALWPGDGSKHSQALREVRRWAGRVGSEGGDLSPEQHQERERYLDLCARMERKGIAGVSAAGSAKP